MFTIGYKAEQLQLILALKKFSPFLMQGKHTNYSRFNVLHLDKIFHIKHFTN